MKSLFSKVDNQEIIDRISQLTSETKPRWGKMNVSQMLTHCQVPFRVAVGDIKLKRGLIGILFGKIAKKQLTSGKPFKKNLPTAKEFIVSEQRDFQEEVKKLIELIQRFEKLNINGLTKEPHPFFGKMTTQEWDNLMWKHLDHHLKQFNV